MYTYTYTFTYTYTYMYSGWNNQLPPRTTSPNPHFWATCWLRFGSGPSARHPKRNAQGHQHFLRFVGHTPHETRADPNLDRALPRDVLGETPKQATPIQIWIGMFFGFLGEVSRETHILDRTPVCYYNII